MIDKYKNLPLRSGVGIVVLNKENKVFVAKRIDNKKTFGKCHREELIREKIFMRPPLGN